MGSLPDLSILRGEAVPAPAGQPQLLHRLLEEVAAGPAANSPAVLYQGECPVREAALPRLECERPTPWTLRRRISYAELDAAASRFARAIVRKVRMCSAGGNAANADGDVLVAVRLPPSDRLLVILLAAIKAGAAYLPLDAAFPPERVRHILTEARPAIVISDQPDPELFRGTIAATYAELQAEAADLSGAPLADLDGLLADPLLALVLYTSGSTGVPKGVRLPHAVVLNRLRWQWRQFPFGDEEALCVFKTALTFVDSVPEIWGPLLQGRAVLVLDKDVTSDTERLVHALEDNQVERLVLVPSLLRAMLMYLKMDAERNADRQNKPLLSRLRLWVCSGESLAASLAEQFFAHFASVGLDSHWLCNFYGSTEIMGDVTFHVLRSAADVQGLDKIPIGSPLDNTVVYLLDEHFRPALAGHAGELFVAGRNLAAGYVAGRDPHRFLDNPLAVHPDYVRLYRTGDFARVDKNTLVFEGRTDSQVKVRGHRVDLSELEAALTRVDGVDKGVVLCHRPGEEDQAVLAFVTLREGSALSARQVESALGLSLPPYAVPQVLTLDWIPLLVNGKVDRQALLRGYAESAALDRSPDYSGAPDGLGDVARVLLDTVAEVLGGSARAKVCLARSFYELGGNSLNSVLTVTRLRDQGFFISVSDFIGAESLSQVLECLKPSEADASLLAESRHQSNFRAEMLSEEHKKDVYSMITDSFLQKADLEHWLMPGVSPSDYSELMDQIWKPLVEKELSCVVKDEAGEAVACALTFDAHDEPPVQITSKLNIVFDFLEFIEGPIRDNKLPTGRGRVLHSFMMATAASLSPRANVLAMQFMEQEVLRTARARGFRGVLTTNTSPLTQQLGRDVFGYQTLLDYQVNQYVAPDGSFPFGEAPDSQRAVVAWKPIQ
ncbi:Mycosubtilin synthase subunit C [Frankliniella fusca]|uniref:Mycosubtilin synthase subunit C n=1 Tax=Frankliniella fusca TaxID=407009 RepID=A0AAE1LGP0_9NEOP|nr:Mycosubtilin synthase subunit C [Frankliniella fusca]